MFLFFYKFLDILLVYFYIFVFFFLIVSVSSIIHSLFSLLISRKFMHILWTACLSFSYLPIISVILSLTFFISLLKYSRTFCLTMSSKSLFLLFLLVLFSWLFQIYKWILISTSRYVLALIFLSSYYVIR